MKNPPFVQNKLTRVIRTSGVSYTFTRYKKDEYGQLTEEVSDTFVVVGVFHETYGYIRKTTADAAVTVGKAQPMIMSHFEESRLLQLDDLLLIGTLKYRVVEVHDIENLGIIGDISLEVI